MPDTPLNTWPKYNDMGIGHEGTKIYQKWVAAIGFTMKIDCYSLAYAILKALQLITVIKKATECHNRKYERETKLDIFHKAE